MPASPLLKVAWKILRQDHTRMGSSTAVAKAGGRQVVNVHVHVGDQKGKKPKKLRRRQGAPRAAAASGPPPVLRTSYGLPPGRYPSFPVATHIPSPYPDAPQASYSQVALTNQQASLKGIQDQLDARFADLHATLASLGGDSVSNPGVQLVDQAQQVADGDISALAGEEPAAGPMEAEPTIIPGAGVSPDVDVAEAADGPATLGDIRALMSEMHAQRAAAEAMADQRAAALAQHQQGVVEGAAARVAAAAAPPPRTPQRPAQLQPPRARPAIGHDPAYNRYYVHEPQDPRALAAEAAGPPRPALEHDLAYGRYHVLEPFDALMRAGMVPPRPFRAGNQMIALAGAPQQPLGAAAGAAGVRRGRGPAAGLLPAPPPQQALVEYDEGRRRLVRQRVAE